MASTPAGRTDYLEADLHFVPERDRAGSDVLRTIEARGGPARGPGRARPPPVRVRAMTLQQTCKSFSLTRSSARWEISGAPGDLDPRPDAGGWLPGIRTRSLAAAVPSTAERSRPSARVQVVERHERAEVTKETIRRFAVRSALASSRLEGRAVPAGYVRSAAIERFLAERPPSAG
jgi:hypothetical protein